MNQDKVNNLKSLVNTSPILSSAEKQEWLQLLGLMNDKQILELEKILVTSVKPKPKEQFVPPVVKSVSSPKSAPMPKRAPSLKPMKHILNMPKFDRGMPATKKPGTVLQKEKPKTSKFWTKVKSVLQEKELPPGHPEYELELPAAHQAAPSTGKVLNSARQKIEEVPKKKLEVPKELTEKKPEPHEALSPQLPKVEKPLAPKPPKAPSPKSPSFVLGAGKAQHHNILTQNLNLKVEKGGNALIYSNKEVKKVQPAETKETEQAVTQVRPSKVEPRPQQKPAPLSKQVFHPPATKPIATPIAKVEKPETIELPQQFVKGGSIHVQEEEIPEEIISKQGLENWSALERATKSVDAQSQSAPTELKSLQDLAKLKVSDFSGSRTDDYSRLIKAIIRKTNYHDAISRLEQSPLYQAYINTGLKMLSDRVDSNSDSLLGDPDKLLTKNQFEKFVDLLRQIQAS